MFYYLRNKIQGLKSIKTISMHINKRKTIRVQEEEREDEREEELDEREEELDEREEELDERKEELDEREEESVEEKSEEYESDNESIETISIKKIQKVTKKKLEICSVCLNNYFNTKTRKYLSCGHCIHSQCFDKLKIYKHSKCPICREFVEQLRNNRIYDHKLMEIIEYMIIY